MRFHYAYRGAEGESFTVSDERLLGAFRPREVTAADVDGMVRSAFDAPLGTPRLRELVRDHTSVAILADARDLSLPLARVLPHVERELRKGGVADDDVTLLVARGAQRPARDAELERLVGPSFLARWRVVQHDWRQEDALVDLGRTPQGVPLRVNRAIGDAEVLLGIGAVRPDVFVGLAGGADVVAPATAGPETMAALAWQGISAVGAGSLGDPSNPVRDAIEDAGRTARLQAVLGLVSDASGHPCASAFGAPLEVHRLLAAAALDLGAVAVPGLASVAVVDGGPDGAGFGQALQNLVTASTVVEPGGSLVLVAPATEGVAGDHRPLLDLARLGVQEIRSTVAGTRDEVAGAFAALVALARRRARLHLVSGGIPRAAAERMGFQWHADVAHAVESALAECGDSATAAVLHGADRLVPRLPPTASDAVAVPARVVVPPT